MPSFADILQCPISGEPLRLLTPVELEQFNARVQKGSATLISGAPVSQMIEAGFTNTGNAYFYVFQDGIACLLPWMAMVTSVDALNAVPEALRLNADKQNVQDFYDQIGWHKGEDDLFEDTLQFEETRPVAKQYISDCHRRLKKHFSSGGDYLLDVASGPLQFQEYLEYSNDYRYRICVDFSRQALQAARKQLGDRGIYILGDITRLPLRDNVIDGVISLHTIYHVPVAEQRNAFLQLHRVLKPGRQAAVVYTWGPHCKLMSSILFPAKVIRKGPRKIREFFNKPPAPTGPPALFYHPLSRQTLEAQNWPFKYAFFSWRCIDLEFMQSYIHEGFGGRQILRWIFQLENTYSNFLGKYGFYPIIVLYK